MNEGLTKAMSERILKGISKDDIKRELVSLGYSEDEFESAYTLSKEQISSLQNQNHEIEKSDTLQPKIFSILGKFILICVFIANIYWIMRFGTFEWGGIYVMALLFALLVSIPLIISYYISKRKQKIHKYEIITHHILLVASITAAAILIIDSTTDIFGYNGMRFFYGFQPAIIQMDSENPVTIFAKKFSTHDYIVSSWETSSDEYIVKYYFDNGKLVGASNNLKTFVFKDESVFALDSLKHSYRKYTSESDDGISLYNGVYYGSGLADFLDSLQSKSKEWYKKNENTYYLASGWVTKNLDGTNSFTNLSLTMEDGLIVKAESGTNARESTTLEFSYEQVPDISTFIIIPQSYSEELL